MDRPAAPRQPFSWPLRCLALFLVVIGARFYLIDHYALSLPYWDQWDGEGAGVIKPWLDGRLGWEQLFRPHNEHRIVLTRLVTLGLCALNNQWDNLLEAGVNALANGVAAVGIVRVLRAALGAAYQGRILLAVAVYFTLPFGWENTLSGFQSQNYFLIWFSLAAVWGLGTRRPGSRGWWAGWLGAVLACLSMATGFLAAVAAAGIVGLRLARERRRPTRGEIWTLLVCLLISAAGWTTRTEVPAHVVLRAESWPLFVVALGRMLAWPWCDVPLLGLAALFAPGLLTVIYCRRATIPGAELLLGTSLWAALQCAALAYGRGGQGALPASRYMDLLAVVALANFLAWQVLVTRAWATPWRVPIVVGAALWLGLLGAGLWPETTKDFDGWLPWYSGKLHRSERNLQGYIDRHDFARFLASKTGEDLPHPDARLLAALVDDPPLRARLPADLRPPLAVRPMPGGPSAFIEGGYDPACGALERGMTWGSFSAAGALGQGSWQARVDSPKTLPYLRFAFAGDLGATGLRFALGPAAGHDLQSFQPAHAPHQHWHQDYLRPPGGEIRLVAEDRNPAAWFAFSEPVEVGFWSYWMGFMLRRGTHLLAAGLLLGVASFLGEARWSGVSSAARRSIAGVSPSGEG